MSTLILREFPLELSFSTSQDREEDTYILRLAGLLSGLRWQGHAAVIHHGSGRRRSGETEELPGRFRGGHASITGTSVEDTDA